MKDVRSSVNHGAVEPGSKSLKIATAAAPEEDDPPEEAPQKGKPELKVKSSDEIEREAFLLGACPPYLDLLVQASRFMHHTSRQHGMQLKFRRYANDFQALASELVNDFKVGRLTDPFPQGHAEFREIIATEDGIMLVPAMLIYMAQHVADSATFERQMRGPRKRALSRAASQYFEAMVVGARGDPWKALFCLELEIPGQVTHFTPPVTATRVNR